MNRVTAWTLVLIIVVLGGWYLYNRSERDTVAIVATSTPNTTNTPNTPNTAANIPVIGSQAGPNDIIVESPVAGDTISSPVRVTGRARGNWYFEASAPVLIVDTSGKVLGQGYVEAQGEWMVATGTVPFVGNITFNDIGTGAGAVVFMNDNPSGLASTSKFLAVPVYFK